MARITRKELKSDKFALEVEHTVTFFEEHRQAIFRYGGAAVVILVLVLGYSFYARGRQNTRQQMLAKAITAANVPVAPPQAGVQTYATQAIKDQETEKLFTDVVNKYGGSTEGEIARYFRASILADQGKLPEAEKDFQEVAQKGDAKYSSLAKLSLAEIYFSENRSDQGEKMLRDLMEHPTIFVSKNQAAYTLARELASRNPAEARKLLQPLLGQPGGVGQAASSLNAQLPQ